MGRAARWTGLVALAALTAGCAYSYSKQAARVREDLIGLRGRSLRGCIGVPASVDLDGEVEYLTYRWSIGSSQATGPTPIGPREEERPGPPRGDSPLRRAMDEDEGLCELVFELRDGRVSGLEAEGRTREGLNWDAGCTLLARRCLPRDR